MMNDKRHDFYRLFLTFIEKHALINPFYGIQTLDKAMPKMRQGPENELRAGPAGDHLLREVLSRGSILGPVHRP